MKHWERLHPTATALDAGIRFGPKGTHTSRTIMLAELSDLLEGTPATTDRAGFAEAIIEENQLGKQTAATRRLTNQRLGELYGLDPSIGVFRVIRRLWPHDQKGRPLVALLAALARDPLLRSTADTVLGLPIGSELSRQRLTDAIRSATEGRLSDATIDKVARNTASSWSQAGHLKGRMRKIRQRVDPTPGSLAAALWLGTVEGLAGEQLLDCQWARVLDRTGAQLVPTALQAKQLGLIHARIGGGVIEIDASRLDAVQLGS